MTGMRYLLLALSIFVLCVSCTSMNSLKTAGTASWYGNEFNGRKTANGEVFNENLFTAAHRTLPFGSIVEVTNTENGKKTQVRINDRGPFIDGRIIDLSKKAFQQIADPKKGLVEVKIKVISNPKEKS